MVALGWLVAEVEPDLELGRAAEDRYPADRARERQTSRRILEEIAAEARQ